MRIVVVGAGITGVSTAEWLRRDGCEVTLVDRVDPGDPAQTSYGNAGVIAACAVVPVSTPGLLTKAPKMLLDPDSPLFLRWSYLPRLLPWLAPFLRAGRLEKVREIAAALSPLIGDSPDQHVALARGTPAEEFVRTGSYGFLYRSRAAFDADAFAFALRREHGAEWEEWEAPRLREADPQLSDAYAFAAVMRHHGWITAPGDYVAALARHFAAAGGRVRRGEVAEIRPLEGGRAAALLRGGETLEADRVVLCAGVWSDGLARGLGHRPKLESERGYHLMLRGASAAPPFPLMIADRKFVATPMRDGLRCAGVVEFGGRDAPPSRAPQALLRRSIAEVYPDLRWEAAESWMGHRPSTPDSLPLLGPSPKAPGVVFAFGAQHIGLTMGPKLGRLAADLVAGRRPNVDLSPYRVDRFD